MSEEIMVSGHALRLPAEPAISDPIMETGHAFRLPADPRISTTSRSSTTRTSPSTPSETSTNILSDDDGQEFLNDWDEWSEHEVGNGPRAHWENVHFTPATAAPTASTSNESNGKSKVDHFVKSITCIPLRSPRL